MCPLNSDPKNRIYLNGPELILDPVGETGSRDFLRPVVRKRLVNRPSIDE
jgi:hypothetical protein